MAENTQAQKQLIFYENPVPIQLEVHGDAGISSTNDYSFSKETNSVPIVHAEFAEVSKHYPIVFAANDKIDPVAVLSLENHKNLFVEKDGSWSKGDYIPAYVRRYPFAFMAANDEQLILCIDENAPNFVKKAGKKDQKFFDNNEQTQLSKNALTFCMQFHNDQLGTHNFTKAINDAGLLIDRQITVTLPENLGSKTMNLAGFKVVDGDKFRTLDDKLLKEWHQNGYLSLIYMHLASLNNFNRLIPKDTQLA